MKPVISFEERIDWIKKEHQFKLKMIELELKSREIDRELQELSQNVQIRSQRA